MEILLDTLKMTATTDISTVAPQNLIELLDKKAEVLKTLVIVHFMIFYEVLHSGQLIFESDICFVSRKFMVNSQ